MTLSIEPISLHLKTPFRIAHGTSDVRQNLLVHIGTGTGEGALPPYYEYNLESVTAYLKEIDAEKLVGSDPFALEAMLNRIPEGPAPGRAAVDIALHDAWAQQFNQPLYRLWGLDPADAPPGSLTISIPENEAELLKHVDEAAAFPVLKLKLGSGDLQKDEWIVRTVREATQARLCVDANSAWTVEEALKIIPRIARYDLLFIEQPLPAEDPESWHTLRRHLPSGVPLLIADESVRQVQDILLLYGAIDGINIKLTKAGGLREARRMITLARALGLRVMIGCMIESGVGITAAAHLTPLVDYVDLDAGLLVVDEIYEGMRLENGIIRLPSSPGLGIRRRKPT